MIFGSTFRPEVLVALIVVIGVPGVLADFADPHHIVYNTHVAFLPDLTDCMVDIRIEKPVVIDVAESGWPSANPNGG